MRTYREAESIPGEYGWNSNFETLVAEIGAKFLRDLKLNNSFGPAVTSQTWEMKL